MTLVCFISFFLGALKAATSNNFVLVLISMEMMVFGIFLLFYHKIWALANIHFFSSLLVFSVLEGVYGLALLVTIFTNSKKLSEGVFSIMI